MVWTAHATPVTDASTTTSTQANELSPAEAALQEQIAANDVKLAEMTATLQTIALQTAAITKTPKTYTKPRTSSSSTSGSTTVSRGTTTPPATNTTTGGSGK